MDQYIGKMLDNRYEILERIGTGGMAVVYKARCHRLNRLVAIKILKPELASDAEFRRRFHDESQAVAMLSHANIVAVYDVSQSDNLDYIVMELVDGMTLKQYMQKRGAPLNWREALHFITQIVRALGHAHSRGIIHRDIKPQNIMVLRDGSVKVTDFGIARVASAAQATLTQEALGSVHYISPEQARGSHIDGRSDLYSAGVVLYEMLTGRLPFEGETPVSVAIQHINSIPIPPRDLNPDIPPALAAITMKAMAPKPENRYASAEEMLAALEEFRKNPDIPAPEQAVTDEPTRVVPVAKIKEENERIYQKSQEIRRRSQEVSGVKSAQWPPERRREREHEEEPERRRGVPPILFAVLAIVIFVAGMLFFVYQFLIKGLFSPAKEYTVPDLTPYTIEELEERPELTQGFKTEIGQQVSSDEYPSGQIMDQSPKAGSTVKEGANMVITLTVSIGDGAFYLDDLTDSESTSAMNGLRAKGLVPEPEYEYNDEIVSGNIIRTYPTANEKVKPGDKIKVYISKGKETEMTVVSDYIDMDINQAQSAAEMAGLVVAEVKEYHSDKYAKGRVMFQSIQQDEKVEKGTEIRFQVSLGPESSPEPSHSAQPSHGPSDPGGNPEPSNTATVSLPKTILVDLSEYSGTVNVRVDVGGTTFFSGSVDADSNPSIQVIAAGSGTQKVEIYVNATLVKSYSLDFTQ